VLKNRGSFPNEEAVIKLVYLALRNISQKWSLPIRDWASAMNGRLGASRNISL
jgi:transposase-like protein